ncbi:MAG: polysaccharide deacetylase family protein [Cyclonatronaceae bacterium]
MNSVAVIMYHYVRDLSRSRYPGIRGLETRAFKEQIFRLNQYYTFVGVEEILEQLDHPGDSFPQKAALLTFDDGYMEHFTEVFPLLNSLDIPAAFFPPVCSTIERKALDVNKIHFILASEDNAEYLLEKLTRLIIRYKSEFDLQDPVEYYNRIQLSEHPYDPLQIITFKRVLQRELPKPARKKIIDELFSEIVGIDEDVFVEELYMKEHHIRLMLKNGMFFGGHGYSHDWLGSMDKSMQTYEVEQTRDFLKHLGADTDGWVMSYPYGDFNDSLVGILKSRNCSLAFTDKGGEAIPHPENRYRVTRIDTNEAG